MTGSVLLGHPPRPNPRAGRALGPSGGGKVLEYLSMWIYVYNHPEVDRIWRIYHHPEVDGVYEENIMVLSKIIFYLLQDGCIYIYIYVHMCIWVYVHVYEMYMCTCIYVGVCEFACTYVGFDSDRSKVLRAAVLDRF